ncbi:hypothetical protein HDU99_007585, partial [Rhizoclosmatium hyalinum]
MRAMKRRRQEETDEKVIVVVPLKLNAGGERPRVLNGSSVKRKGSRAGVVQETLPKVEPKLEAVLQEENDEMKEEKATEDESPKDTNIAASADSVTDSTPAIDEGGEMETGGELIEREGIETDTEAPNVATLEEEPQDEETETIDEAEAIGEQEETMFPDIKSDAEVRLPLSEGTPSETSEASDVPADREMQNEEGELRLMESASASSAAEPTLAVTAMYSTEATPEQELCQSADDAPTKVEETEEMDWNNDDSVLTNGSTSVDFVDGISSIGSTPKSGTGRPRGRPPKKRKTPKGTPVEKESRDEGPAPTNGSILLGPNVAESVDG